MPALRIIVGVQPIGGSLIGATQRVTDAERARISARLRARYGVATDAEAALAWGREVIARLLDDVVLSEKHTARTATDAAVPVIAPVDE